jgi:hypothetical protein
MDVEQLEVIGRVEWSSKTIHSLNETTSKGNVFEEAFCSALMQASVNSSPLNIKNKSLLKLQTTLFVLFHFKNL